MEPYKTNLEAIKILQNQHLSLLTIQDFAKIFSEENKNTLYKKIARLEKNEIIKKLTKGKYVLTLKPPNDFLTANFLYKPSYVSLESALSLYGIITGFPHQVTSITTKKTKTVVVLGKEFHYTQISRKLFFGYEKKEDFLIAEKEKALFDYLYLTYKGLKTLDKDELDLSGVDKNKLKNYLKIQNSRTFLFFCEKYI